MKISRSKPDERTGKRHLVLRVEAKEVRDAHRVICDDLLGRNVRPVIKKASGGARLYLFNQKFLDLLLVTFPMAELSPGLDAQLSRAAMAHFKKTDVPEVVVPGFLGTLYDFQKIGVDEVYRSLKSEGNYMLNDEMGLGKTVQAICVAILTGGKCLVVTTNSGKRAWRKIINRLFEGVEAVMVEGTADKRAVQIRERAQITLVNVEAIRVQVDKRGRVTKWANPDLFNYDYDLLIVDEFHKCKNPKSQQTLGFLRLRARHNLMMSGTPILNNPLEYWPALHKIAPDKYPSYWAFEKNLAIMSSGPFRSVVGYRPEAMLELRKFTQKYSIRRRKDQVGIEMPKVIHTTVEVDLNAEQRRLYNRIRDEFKLALADGTITNVSTALAQITRLKQACFSPELYGGSSTSVKISQLHDIVEELVAADQKAIIFSQWSTATRIIQREFAKYNPAYVDGTVSAKQREAEEDRFNNDPECKLYIGTIKANQEAITLSAATYVIFMDKDWTPLANDQAAARSAAGGLRGAGTTVPVNIIEMLASDTFEERIEDLLAKKKALFNSVVEKDGGQAVERVTLRDIRSLL